MSNDPKRYEGMITNYAAVVSHLLRRYGFDGGTVKADEEIRNFKERSLTPSDFSQKLWDLTVR